MSQDSTLVNGGEKPKRVKAIVLTTTGSGNDYSNLQVREEDYPKIEKNDQCIVRIKATGLNFAELMQRQGMYKPSTKTPYTPGYEASGIIEEVGSEVTDLKVNDRVLVFNASGMWKEVVRVPRMHVVKIPNEMTFEDAAGLLVNYVTAYQVLFRMANVKPNDVVLIHMAAGGVGFAATQLCKTIPGVVVIGTASLAKHEAIKANGVDHPIDYTSTSYVTEIKKLFPDGVDVVLDPLNGDNSIKGYELLRPLGRIVHFGAASMTTESRSLINALKTWWKCLSINSLEIMSENKGVMGYHLGVLLANESAMKKVMEDLKILMGMYKTGQIKIQIDSTFAYSKIGEAMKRMHTRQNVGKIILKPDSECPKEEVTSENQVNVSTTVTTPKTVEEKTSKSAAKTTTSPVVAEEKKETEKQQTPAKTESVPAIEEKTPISA